MKTYFQVIYRSVEGLGIRWFVREYLADGTDVAIHGGETGWTTVGSASSMATHFRNKQMGLY